MRVLIVDDHVLVRCGVVAFLRRYGDQFEICGEAADGRQAVEKAQELKPDIVLMDITMPLMSGLDAAKAILCQAPTMSIIFYTVHNHLQILAEARRIGAKGYICKHTLAENMPAIH